MVLVITSGACLPTPSVADAGSSTSSGGACGVWHPDDDGDGFGAAGIAIDTCDPPPGWSLDDRDCYDANADARPDQAEYFAVHRGDGTFDYDCDGFATVRLRDLGGCHGEPACPDDVGWRHGLAGCGAVQEWVIACGEPGGGEPTCTWFTELEVQTCR